MVYYKFVKVIINISDLIKVIINIIMYYHNISKSIIISKSLFFILKF